MPLTRVYQDTRHCQWVGFKGTGFRMLIGIKRGVGYGLTAKVYTHPTAYQIMAHGQAVVDSEQRLSSLTRKSSSCVSLDARAIIRDRISRSGEAVKPDNIQPSLKPRLSLLDAAAINIGAIIGAGIFVVTGIVAGLAGSALVVSLLFAAIVSLFTALSFAELSSALPKEGGSYEFAYELVSPFAGFTAGWMWLISNIFVGPALALGFSQYLVTLLPEMPVKPAAIIITAVFALVNILGAKSSATINNVLVGAKLLILGFFIALGSLHMSSGNLKPFSPFEPGVLYGAYFVFFAFTGFARVTLLSEEVQDAQKNVPRSIMLALLISTIVYLAVGFVAVGLVGAEKLKDSASPLATAISIIGTGITSQVVSVGGLIATASVLLTTILGVSRLGYAMAQKNELPRVFGTLHRKFETPYVAILVSSLLMMLLVFVSTLSQVVAVSTFASLVYYGIGNLSAMRLNPKRRLYPRVVPLFGVISCAVFLLFVLFKSPEIWLIGIIILALGAVYYILDTKRTKNPLRRRTS
jgi:APA family basic amino acid/polyamine antiporter